MDNLEMSINRAEVLRYLGYRGGDIDSKVTGQLDLALEKVLASYVPRYIYAIYPLERNGGIALSGTVFTPEGRDIERHLEGCDRVILIAVTMGEGVEGEIRRTQLKDMALAAVIDATADAAMDSACNSLHSKLEREFADKYLTEWFSPGYGDMPLSQQRPLCLVLDTARKIGVSINDSFLLSPGKSVTALVGISNNPVKRSGRGCENCNMSEICEYRRAGKTCAE